jgi:hypothetical protein
METTMKRETRITRLRRWATRALPAAAAFVLVLAAALPADAQATRTRPSGDRGSSSGSSAGSSSSPPVSVSGSSGSTSRPAPRSGGPAAGTRPPAGSGGVIDVDNRSSRRGGYYPGYYPHRYGYYSDYWYPYRYSWWLGYWGWYGWPYPYQPYPHTYPYYGGGGGGYYEPAYYGSRVRPSMGALDLDLKPGDTQIWLDGQLIGSADDFDGWPQYLWLEEGDYHFVFFHPSRRTIAREYKIYPGVVIDVEDRLERGESTPPEELFPVPTARRDDRLRQNEEKRRRAEAEAAADWRQRSEAIRRRTADEDDGRGDADVTAATAEDFGSLELTVEPPDASVYLDGRFLGTAEDLVRLRRGLTVDAGEHELSVVRPGYAPEELAFEVEAGEEVRLSVRLERQ